MKTLSSAVDFDMLQISWRNYKKIKSKALSAEEGSMDLIISLSSAFFVVILSSYSLSSVYYLLLSKAI